MQDNKVIAETPLEFTGEVSTFAGKLPVKTAGAVEVVVLAMNPGNANFGIVREKLTVTR
ncbi:MAG: hypothetical protein ACE5IR_06305 [bacterium]